MEIPAYMSYSSFTTFIECGWKFYLTRVEKIEEPPAYWFAGGSAVHAAADAIDHGLLAEVQA